MKTIRYRSKGQEVYLLEELLVQLGYDVFVSTFFGMDTHQAVIDFQSNHLLVVDGIVGPKTWSKLIEAEKQLTTYNNKLLSENDIRNFAKEFGLELPLVKAVNEIESRGKGFLIEGKPKILFEGHIFWRELEKRGISPLQYATKLTKDVLYKRWTKKYYQGGIKEYTRLEKAAKISDKVEFHNAAYTSASWGSFQIMGFHYQFLEYTSIDNFVADMYMHEREHLRIFGKFISLTMFKGKTLVHWLKEKNWEKFAEGYNGSGFRKNKYDQKLKKAYEYYVRLQNDI